MESSRLYNGQQISRYEGVESESFTRTGAESTTYISANSSVFGESNCIMSSKKLLAAIVVTLLTFFLSQSTLGQGTWADYGEKCNISDPSAAQCNVNKHLICIGNDTVCGCSGSGDLYYDNTTYTCTAFAGRVCNTHPSVGYPKPCTNNAHCKVNASGPGSDGVCECDRDYGFMAAGDTGLCRLGHNAGECRILSDCNTEAFLTCSYGTCVCNLNTQQNVTEQVWKEDLNEDHSTCVSLAGADCTRGRLCVENANCNNTRRCECNEDEGFVATADRYCLLGFGEDCTDNSDCASGKCNPSEAEEPRTCGCPDGEFTVNNQTCLSPPGHHCENNNCVQNATCSVVGQNSICTCDEGFSPLGNYCKADYNTICPVDPATEICNEDAHLGCKGPTGATNGVCECQDGYQYNTTSQKCQGFYGQDCIIDRESDCVFSTQCVTEAGVNVCRCVAGLQQGKGDVNVCRAEYGGSCSVYECDTYIHQVCNSEESTCKCKPELFYQISQLKCVAKIGGMCDINQDLLCVDNANCQESTSTCVCNDQWHPNGDGSECSQGGSGSGTLTTSATFISIFIVFMKLF